MTCGSPAARMGLELALQVGRTQGENQKRRMVEHGNAAAARHTAAAAPQLTSQGDAVGVWPLRGSCVCALPWHCC